ncbi:MAG: DUF5012 domain-containing protein [Saprospiraceae bacterium]
MKYLSFVLLCSLFIFSSCEEDGSEPSIETFLPKLVMSGESDVNLNCSTTSYSDPGVVATENGQNVDLIVNTAGRYFGSSIINTADIYDISYTAYNKDSIPGTAFRTVFLPPCNGDMVSSIEGVYTSTIVRNGSTSAQYTNLKYILIKKVGDNSYQLSDAIGGYYDFGRQYGPHYAATNMVVTNNGGAYSSDDIIPVGDFEGNLSLTDFTVDSASKTIKFTTDWDAGFVFEVTLQQAN